MLFAHTLHLPLAGLQTVVVVSLDGKTAAILSLGVFTGQATSDDVGLCRIEPLLYFDNRTGYAQTNWIADVIDRLPADADVGTVYQADASTTNHAQDGPVIVTDPPYYGQIHYADSSDFFYVWLRSALRRILSRSVWQAF